MGVCVIAVVESELDVVCEVYMFLEPKMKRLRVDDGVYVMTVESISGGFLRGCAGMWNGEWSCEVEGIQVRKRSVVG